MSDEASQREFFKQMFGGSWITQGLWVAAELGIADLLADGPRTVEELAETTRTHPGALYRLLRALAGVGIFAQDAQQRFSLTPLADLLRTDVRGSQRSVAIMMGGELHAAWGELLHTVRTGEPGFQKRFGVHFFQYMTEHPERHSIYDVAMTAIHGEETDPMLDAYDFGALGTVVDIGGGHGLVLAAILKRYPAVRGILFDLPAVADRARVTIVSSGVADRIRIEGGDVFSSVPAGADAYVLRHILHDWEDPEAIAILRRCRRAMAPGGKILVVETVIPLGNEPSFGKWLDLMMLLVAGRERTKGVQPSVRGGWVADAPRHPNGFGCQHRRGGTSPMTPSRQCFEADAIEAHGTRGECERRARELKLALRIRSRGAGKHVLRCGSPTARPSRQWTMVDRRPDNATPRVALSRCEGAARRSACPRCVWRRSGFRS